MKNMKKALLIILCVVAIIGATIMGTLAWLTDEATVENTMTVGKVDITVDETEVDINGKPVDDPDRVTSNKYHLIPGQRYTKDPTMTVAADSEEAYVRMLLTLNCKTELDAIFAPDGVELTTIFKGYDASNWRFEKETADTAANTVTYEFRYKEVVKPTDEAVVLEPLFREFVVPGYLSGEDMASIEDLTITVTGHAIQAAGFNSEVAAWEAFEQQVDS